MTDLLLSRCLHHLGPTFSVAARKATSAMRCRGLACANTAAGHVSQTSTYVREASTSILVPSKKCTSTTNGFFF